jgi:hypothetical protein
VEKDSDYCSVRLRKEAKPDILRTMRRSMAYVY